ncbi:MAG: Amuc_1100 family pilus-like protein [Kiritimatiellia bacterium]
MTGSRKKLFLGAFWGGLLLLAAGSGFLVFLALKNYMAERAKLGTVKSNLEGLYQMAPFPSQENVEMEVRNLATLQTALSELQTALARSQVEPTELKQPTVFMESFWAAQKDMLNHAKNLDVSLPVGFGFGMDAYLKGAPPKPDHVPRLMQQLAIIKSLCDLLFAAKVTSIEAVGREDFEGDGTAESAASAEPATSRRGRRSEAVAESASRVMMVNPNAGIMAPDALFSTMKFAFVFKAKESSVLQVLNALAANDMFIAVKKVTWNAPMDQVAIRKQVFKGGAENAEPTSAKENRVVSGRESTLTIRLDLEVYRFTRKAGS